MDKLKADLIVEAPPGLFTEGPVAIEKLAHNLVGILELNWWYRIGCSCIIASDIGLILHNRRLGIVILPDALLDLTRVHMIEDALAVLIAPRKMSLIAIAISCMWINENTYSSLRLLSKDILLTIEVNAQAMLEVSLPFAQINAAIGVPLNAHAMTTIPEPASKVHTAIRIEVFALAAFHIVVPLAIVHGLQICAAFAHH